MSNKVENGKKANKKVIVPVAIIAGILAIVLIFGIIAGILRSKSFYEFNAYDRLIVQTQTNKKFEISKDDDVVIKTGNTTQKAQDLIQEGLNKSRYSMLTGIFQGTWSSESKFQTTEEKTTLENGLNETNTVKYKYNSAKLDSIATSLQEDEYVLIFCFTDLQSMTVEGEEVKYDRALVAVNDSQAKILEYTFFLYEDAKKQYADTDNVYEIVPIIVKADTYKLYSNVNTIVKNI